MKLSDYRQRSKAYSGHMLVLAIEVLSPGNSSASMLEKTKLYLANGVRAVWIVDGYAKHIKIHTATAAGVPIQRGYVATPDPLPSLQVELAPILPVPKAIWLPRDSFCMARPGSASSK